jgi:peptide chain release factor 2
MALDRSEEDSSFLRELEQTIVRCEALLAGGAYLRVQAGAGGVDACDWAEMLLRMYTRWVEQHSFAAEIIAGQRHEQAGLLEATLHITGLFAHGWLAGETGIHRLVRISPFGAAGRRCTAFAAVDVLPEFGDREGTDIPPEELVRTTFRTGGPGGQFL